VKTIEADGPGVYVIRCIASGRVYVGSSSTSVQSRRKHHFAKLNSRRHSIKRMQDDFDLHGGESLVFEVEQLVADGEHLIAEENAIAKYRATDPEYGYNTRIKATDGRPVKDESERLVLMPVRVSQEMYDIVHSWGKDKGRKLAAAIRAEKARED